MSLNELFSFINGIIPTFAFYNTMIDILGKALLDYTSGNYTEDIITYSSLDETDSIPIPYLFRVYKEMPVLEQQALKLCKGTILDIGCGAGSHSNYLQENGFFCHSLRLF